MDFWNSYFLYENLFIFLHFAYYFCCAYDSKSASIDFLFVLVDLKAWSNQYKDLTQLEMFSLFYGLWKYLFSKTEFHVLILGIDKSGKTVMHLHMIIYYDTRAFFFSFFFFFQGEIQWISFEIILPHEIYRLSWRSWSRYIRMWKAFPLIELFLLLD